jgi:hypothetical protein
MLESINRGMRLNAADELRNLNARISLRDLSIKNARHHHDWLRDNQNEDLRRRAEVVARLRGRLDAAPAGAEGFDDLAADLNRLDDDPCAPSSLIAHHSALEHEAMDDINGGGPDDIGQFDAGGEA